MILLDANLLIYASVAELRQHERAVAWLDERLNGSERVGIPWTTLLGFMRITSNPRLFRSASLEQAWQQVRRWLGVPVVWIPQPMEAHQQILDRLLEQADHRLISDAHLAALAIEHGLLLCSSDGDFARFEGLRWKNPLKENTDE